MMETLFLVFNISTVLTLVFLVLKLCRRLPANRIVGIVYVLFAGAFIYGYIGSFGQAAAATGGLSFLPSSFEFPVWSPDTADIDSKGNTIVGLHSGGRIQIYDAQGRFLRGWFTGTIGSSFILQVTPRDQIEVFTLAGPEKLTYNLQGVLLGKAACTEAAYYAVNTNPAVGSHVKAAWPRWPLANFLIAFLLVVIGGFGLSFMEFLGKFLDRRQEEKETSDPEQVVRFSMKRQLHELFMSSHKTLAESPNYVLAHEREDVFIIDRNTGREFHAGNHYGDPKFGVIAPDESWFATGGEGVILYSFKNGLQEFFRRQQEPVFISAMRFEAPDGLRFLIDPWSNQASVWRLYPATGKLEKLCDGPDLRDELYREDVPY